MEQGFIQGDRCYSITRYESRRSTGPATASAGRFARYLQGAYPAWLLRRYANDEQRELRTTPTSDILADMQGLPESRKVEYELGKNSGPAVTERLLRFYGGSEQWEQRT